ncbi:MAG: hypothetical protein FWF65_09220 [Bacteroidetes bacterium]|nr:hypothetical protein [Bacteroidota bacterium]
MKKLIFSLCFALSGLALCAQFNIIEVNKQLKDFPDVYDLSTPLNAGITCTYFLINGTDNLWDDASVERYPEPNKKNILPNRVVDETIKERFLNDTIKELIIYKDSIAGLLIKRCNSDRYNIRILILENGRWLNYCENGGGASFEYWREWFYTTVLDLPNRLQRTLELKAVSTDTLAFVNYVKQYGAEPKEFLLKALAQYPLVIYGEIHRSKVSWDLLSSLLIDPRFPETVGTIFVELPSYQQDEFDRFYASKKLNTEILLDIMRSFQIDGWFDKGEYEFLINVWKLNQTLPANKQIRVIATDEQLPYKSLHSKEDFENARKNAMDRNTCMADVVEHTLKTKADKRNCLFTVGFGHAYKSHVPGGYSSAEGQEPALSAGAQLAQRLSDKSVFTIQRHVPCMTNNGAFGLVRQGLFDYVFEKNGNQPVAFNLDDSPFGREPYDADLDNAFDSRAGNYANNFDGYIFLQPLKDEDSDYILYDIVSDKFVNEIKRREAISGWKLYRSIKGELTKEKIIESLKEEDEGKKRFGYLFE